MRVRRQIYSLEQFLKLIKSENIRTDSDVQRLSGQWKPNMIGELIFTTLTNDYIPPIILGEEIVNDIQKMWLIDGLQRSTSLSMFRYGNTKISKSIDEYMVTYQRKVMDESGNVKRDGNGEIVWESVQCDIRNKTYEQLPEELRGRFNEYQIETVIYQDCETMDISKLVRRFNNHVSMNTAQKAFTYVDAFAKEIRDLTENKFFLDVYTCSRNDKRNGTIERVIGETALLCNYPEQYRKDTKQGFKWLNENAAIYDFECVKDLVTRLAASLEATTEIRALFNSKNAHIFITAFKAFLEMGYKDKDYGEFLEWFIHDGEKIQVDGKTWETWNENKATRDAATVHGKISYLMSLVELYTKKTRKVA